jgi:hypothetical protein
MLPLEATVPSINLSTYHFNPITPSFQSGESSPVPAQQPPLQNTAPPTRSPSLTQQQMAGQRAAVMRTALPVKRNNAPQNATASGNSQAAAIAMQFNAWQAEQQVAQDLAAAAAEYGSQNNAAKDDPALRKKFMSNFSAHQQLVADALLKGSFSETGLETHTLHRILAELVDKCDRALVDLNTLPEGKEARKQFRENRKLEPLYREVGQKARKESALAPPAHSASNRPPTHFESGDLHIDEMPLPSTFSPFMADKYGSGRRLPSQRYGQQQAHYQQWAPQRQAQYWPRPQQQLAPQPYAQYWPRPQQQLAPQPHAQYWPQPQQQQAPQPHAQYWPRPQQQLAPQPHAQYWPRPQQQLAPQPQAQYRPSPQQQQAPQPQGHVNNRPTSAASDRMTNFFRRMKAL